METLKKDLARVASSVKCGLGDREMVNLYSQTVRRWSRQGITTTGELLCNFQKLRGPARFVALVLLQTARVRLSESILWRCVHSCNSSVSGAALFNAAKSGYTGLAVRSIQSLCRCRSNSLRQKLVFLLAHFNPGDISESIMPALAAIAEDCKADDLCRAKAAEGVVLHSYRQRQSPARSAACRRVKAWLKQLPAENSSELYHTVKWGLAYHRTST